MTSDLQTRLAQALAHRKLDMKGASRKAGLGDTYVRDVLKRGINPTASAALKLAEALDVRIDWLLAGAGEMEAGPEEPSFREFYDLFTRLSDHDQAVVLRVMQGFSEKGE